jgi:Spy/CpxP family protein refolding chaperone
MKTVKILLMSTLLTAVTMTAFGQQGSPPIQPGGQTDETGVVNTVRPGRGGQMSGARREEVRKKIEAVRIWRLNEALKLDPDTSAKLSSLLSSFDQQRRDIRSEQRRTMKRLRLAVRSNKLDGSKIKTDLDTIEKNHHAMQELKNSETLALKNILTIEQQARYLVFQQDFRREMRGMIKRSRRNGQGRTGMGPGAGMGGGPPDN